METKSRKTGLDLAVQRFGSVDGLAGALEITKQAIYMWRGRIPRLRAFEIEALTHGELKAADLLKPRLPKNSAKRSEAA